MLTCYIMYIIKSHVYIIMLHMNIFILHDTCTVTAAYCHTVNFKTSANILTSFLSAKQEINNTKISQQDPFNATCS